MKQILDGTCAIPVATASSPHADAARDARMRVALQAFAAAAAAGSLRLHLPQRLTEPTARGEGHFHLAPELFLQTSGWTDFRFPTGGCRLRTGEALVLPSQLRHAERVGADRGDAPFENLVVFAEAPLLTCHQAHEQAAGEPGVAYLQARRHAQAARIHEWLCDASRQGAVDDDWAQPQARALVAAALAGVLRALDQDEGREAGEPALVARLRVLIQNQLGDAALSVQRLAQQSGVSADHLAQLFRRNAGEPLVAHINRLRMERAARLLRETGLSGKEVAWACGFGGHSYFIRVFRRHHGLAPHEWRERASRPVPF
ncbi:Transcriptional regulator, AraC family [Rubrivivax sp. A210]|uniref:helix-turn-helix transcriptional regulator n=1 Tax=Rubrivivax sp. A210 TaxID=2772301 RepID=UPI00191B1913|nr:helix-turn-helix transcriptional regulator [Rubrivivax sp. A210]CAD5366280.1 Transcriptional regulator, AraC family [Rubrivivax sp. A210]